jgi:quinol monooxygenase YgiN
MGSSVVYVDSSDVRPGKLDELKAAITELADFIEANEPELLAYNVYFEEGGGRMSVVHVHRDAASLEFHLKVAGPLFPRFASHVELRSIDVYGPVGADIMDGLRQKAAALGGATVVSHEHHAGFARFGG